MAAITLLTVSFAGLLAPAALAAPAMPAHCERPAAAEPQHQHNHCDGTATTPSSTGVRSGAQKHCHSCCLGMTARASAKSIATTAARATETASSTMVCEHSHRAIASTQIRLTGDRAPPHNLL